MTAQDRLSRLVSENPDVTAGDAEERLTELQGTADDVRTDAVDDADVLSAMSNETRCVLLHVLRQSEDELSVCELSPVVDVSESAVSHALSDLMDAGLVDRRREVSGVTTPSPTVRKPSLRLWTRTERLRSCRRERPK